jgi:hypothetical protein
MMSFTLDLARLWLSQQQALTQFYVKQLTETAEELHDYSVFLGTSDSDRRRKAFRVIEGGVSARARLAEGRSG